MQLTAESVALITVGSAMIYVLWMPATWLLMGVITPKSLMDRYFKEPHFTFGETIWLRQFPGSLMRTMIFCAMILHPRRGRNRKMTDIREYTPRWFEVAAKLFVVFSIGQFVITIGLLIGLLIYTEIVDAQNGAMLLRPFGVA